MFEELDPELLRLVSQTSAVALAAGAQPRKRKLLIAMALAQMTVEAGATKQETVEPLTVPQYVSGVGSLYTAAHALQGLS